jgi:hypothetical protein
MIKRKANALISDARPAINIYFFSFTDPHLLASAVSKVALESFARCMGGLWVGGTAQLSNTSVEFIPNSVNLALNTGSLYVRIPLMDILDVDVAKGIITDIISIRTENGTLKIRCFSAKQFAEEISNAKNRIS